ncbi:MAG: hypothetical protein ACLUOD_15285 [[Clostridium] innocuum]
MDCMALSLSYILIAMVAIQLVWLGAGQPHSYIAKDYATITVKDTTGKSVFERDM